MYFYVLCTRDFVLPSIDQTENFKFFQWPYNEFYGISPSAKSPGEFIINVKKGICVLKLSICSIQTKSV